MSTRRRTRRRPGGAARAAAGPAAAVPARAAARAAARIREQMVRRSRGFLGPPRPRAARARVRARRVGVLAGRRPDCGRRRARTRGRRNKSKVWTRKTHDALRAAGFRAAQLRDRLEWVDAQRRSGREHGEEARQRSHRKGTSRWATAAAGCRPSSNSQIRRTRLLDPGGLIARRMSASNTRLRIKEALVPSTKNTASSRPHRSLMHQIRRAQIPGRARARGLRPRA